MRKIVVGLLVLAACKSDPPSAPADEPSADGTWKPRHGGVKPAQLAAMPTKPSTVAFSKAGVRATIALPAIYVVGRAAGIVNEVRELPADACADDNIICSVAFHAETLRLPGFQLRVGPMPTASDVWTCEADRCAKNERNVGKYSTELHVQRVYRAGDRALVCTSYFTVVGKEPVEIDAWMAKVCDEVVIEKL